MLPTHPSIRFLFQCHMNKNQYYSVTVSHKAWRSQKRSVGDVVLFLRISHGRICAFCFSFRTLGFSLLTSSDQVRKHEMLSFVLI